MTISSLSSATSSTQTADQVTKKNILTQEDFLNIFTAQMRYQNPLEPLNNEQMATQMAQLSSLEALNNMTEILENISANQASMYSLQATNLIGKKVEAVGNSLSIDGGKVSEGYYQLSKTGKVTVQIYNASGNLMRVIEEGVKDTSKQTLVWDGKDQEGVNAPDGTYTFQIKAVDEKGSSIDVTSYKVDTITGISFKNGVIYLNCRSGKFTLSDIITILT